MTFDNSGKFISVNELRSKKLSEKEKSSSLEKDQTKESKSQKETAGDKNKESNEKLSDKSQKDVLNSEDKGQKENDGVGVDPLGKLANNQNILNKQQLLNENDLNATNQKLSQMSLEEVHTKL